MPSTASVPPLDDIPSLTLRLATPTEYASALKLICDSIAQQRQTLNRSLILHPSTIATFLAFVAILQRKYSTYNDLPILIIISAAVAVVLLTITKPLSVGYLERAEEVGTKEGLEKYLAADNADTIVAIWREEIIGAVVVRYPKKGQAEVWAWVVRLRYRGTGLGRDLLQQAIARARERQGKNCTIKFAEDHANSHRIGFIPQMYNATFDKREAQAKEALKELVRKK